MRRGRVMEHDLDANFAQMCINCLPIRHLDGVRAKCRLGVRSKTRAYDGGIGQPVLIGARHYLTAGGPIGEILELKFASRAASMPSSGTLKPSSM